MSSDPYAWIEKSLATIHRAEWYRSVQTIYGRPGATILLEGRELVNFASNDYLGLAGDERLIQAAVSAVKEFGTGSTGSRLLTGHRELHRELELAIASLKQTEDAVVFSSGYLANLGAIASLVGKRDLILSDQYNHSSLKNGAILSGAAVVEYNHCDVEDLRAKLQECVGVASPRHRYRRCLILTDSVFSMDGDLCPLPQLLSIAEEFNCMLLVDEAHATGVFGENGAGCVEYLGCTGKPLIQVGTLSKALGSLGGYVAGSSSLIDFLRNRAPSWIYTTGLTPADTAAALKAVNIVREEPQLRHQLWQNIETLKTLLDEQIPNWNGTDKNYPDRNCHRNLESEGNSQLPITNSRLPISNYQLPITNSYSPIFCFLLKDAAQALAVGKQLKEQGIFAPAIRPPTVNYSRIRVSLMATHELVHIEKLVEALGAMPAAGYAYAFLKKT